MKTTYKQSLTSLRRSFRTINASDSTKLILLSTPAFLINGKPTSNASLSTSIAVIYNTMNKPKHNNKIKL